MYNFLKKFLNSIKLFLLFSTEISSTEYRDVAYVQYWDVQVPRCPDTILQFLTFQWKRSVNKPTLDFWQMLQRPVISRMHTLDGS
jgi:hypothetical protein